MRLVRIWLLAVMASACAGCGDRIARVDPMLSEGGVAVFVRIGPDKEISEVGVVELDDARSVSAQDGDVLALFSLDPLTFVDANGAPPTRLDGLSARTIDRPAPAGSCGRCPVPVDSPPQPITDGAACEIPRFSSSRAFRHEGGDAVPIDLGALEDSIRAGVVIDWPGACACRPPIPTNAPNVDTCTLFPEPDAVSADVLAVDAVGGIGVFNRGALLVVDADGSRRRVSPQPALGPILAAGAFAPGRFLIVAEEPGASKDEPEAFVVDALGLARVDGFPRVEPSSIGRLGAPDRVFVAGREISGVNQRTAAIHVCQASADVRDCRRQRLLMNGCFLENNVPIRDVVQLESGAAVAVAGSGHVFVRAPGSEDWRCDPQTDEFEIVGATGRLEVSALFFASSLGGRMFACGFGHAPSTPDERVSIVITATISAAGDLPPLYELSELDSGSQCTSISKPIPDRIRVVIRGGERAADLDDSGRITDRFEGVGAGGALFGEVPHPVDRIATTSVGSVLATIYDELYLVTPAEPNPRRIVGSDDAPASALSAIVSDGPDHVLGFRGAEPPIRITTGAGCDGGSADQVTVDGWSADPSATAVRATRSDSLEEIAVIGGSSRGAHVRFFETDGDDLRRSEVLIHRRLRSSAPRSSRRNECSSSPESVRSSRSTSRGRSTRSISSSTTQRPQTPSAPPTCSSCVRSRRAAVLRGSLATISSVERSSVIPPTRRGWRPIGERVWRAPTSS